MVRGRLGEGETERIGDWETGRMGDEEKTKIEKKRDRMKNSI